MRSRFALTLLATAVSAVQASCPLCPVSSPNPAQLPGTPEVNPADFAFEGPGVSRFEWSKTAPYIDLAAADTTPRFSTVFPDASVGLVRLCDEPCALAELEIQPERGSHRLSAVDFPEKTRVVARVILHNYVAGTGSDRSWVPRLLGLTEPDDVSYLVTLPDGRATFMFKSGDRIAFTKPWAFEAAADSFQVLNRTQARWQPHLHARHVTFASTERPHLSMAWLACADGCCTAQPAE
jgi:hypothetical protein